MKILVVEDNHILQRQLVRALRDQAYTVDSCGEGVEALYMIRNGRYDLVVLDIMLPGMTGLEILKEVRVDNAVPILLLTARDALDNRVEGLDLGADDYLTKPFELAELMARSRSLLRRSQNSPTPRLTFEDVEIDTNSGKAFKNDEEIPLTNKEFSIILKLALARGQIISTPDLLESILDEEDDSLSNSLNVHIHNVRKKLGKNFIRTIRGRGYLIE